MSDEFAWRAARLGVAQICEAAGFEKSNSSAFDVLTEVYIAYLKKLGKRCRVRAEDGNRTETNVLDLHAALTDLGLRVVDNLHLEIRKGSNDVLSIKNVGIDEDLSTMTKASLKLLEPPSDRNTDETTAAKSPYDEESGDEDDDDDDDESDGDEEQVEGVESDTENTIYGIKFRSIAEVGETIPNWLPPFPTIIEKAPEPSPIAPVISPAPNTIATAEGDGAVSKDTFNDVSEHLDFIQTSSNINAISVSPAYTIQHPGHSHNDNDIVSFSDDEDFQRRTSLDNLFSDNNKGYGSFLKSSSGKGNNLHLSSGLGLVMGMGVDNMSLVPRTPPDMSGTDDEELSASSEDEAMVQEIVESPLVPGKRDRTGPTKKVMSDPDYSSSITTTYGAVKMGGRAYGGARRSQGLDDYAESTYEEDGAKKASAVKRDKRNDKREKESIREKDKEEKRPLQETPINSAVEVDPRASNNASIVPKMTLSMKKHTNDDQARSNSKKEHRANGENDVNASINNDMVSVLKIKKGVKVSRGEGKIPKSEKNEKGVKNEKTEKVIKDNRLSMKDGQDQRDSSTTPKVPSPRQPVKSKASSSLTNSSFKGRKGESEVKDGHKEKGGHGSRSPSKSQSVGKKDGRKPPSSPSKAGRSGKDEFKSMLSLVVNGGDKDRKRDGSKKSAGLSPSKPKLHRSRSTSPSPKPSVPRFTSTSGDKHDKNGKRIGQLGVKKEKENGIGGTKIRIKHNSMSDAGGSMGGDDSTSAQLHESLSSRVPTEKPKFKSTGHKEGKGDIPIQKKKLLKGAKVSGSGKDKGRSGGGSSPSDKNRKRKHDGYDEASLKDHGEKRIRDGKSSVSGQDKKLKVKLGLSLGMDADVNASISMEGKKVGKGSAPSVKLSTSNKQRQMEFDISNSHISQINVISKKEVGDGDSKDRDASDTKYKISGTKRPHSPSPSTTLPATVEELFAIPDDMDILQARSRRASANYMSKQEATRAKSPTSLQLATPAVADSFEKTGKPQVIDTFNAGDERSHAQSQQITPRPVFVVKDKAQPSAKEKNPLENLPKTSFGDDSSDDENLLLGDLVKSQHKHSLKEGKKKKKDKKERKEKKKHKREREYDARPRSDSPALSPQRPTQLLKVPSIKLKISRPVDSQPKGISKSNPPTRTPTPTPLLELSQPHVEYNCIMCKEADTEAMISCDKCETWMHFGCVGLTQAQVDGINQWFCENCR
eukprot:CFRG3942T1